MYESVNTIIYSDEDKENECITLHYNQSQTDDDNVYKYCYVCPADINSTYGFDYSSDALFHNVYIDNMIYPITEDLVI